MGIRSVRLPSSGTIMAAQVIMKNACIEALGAEEANILINGVVVTLSPDTCVWYSCTIGTERMENRLCKSTQEYFCERSKLHRHNPLIPVNSDVLQLPPLPTNHCPRLRKKSSDVSMEPCKVPSSPPSALSRPHGLTTSAGGC